ncbi:MAG: CoA-binding protein [Thermodesulfobacteriota bacterium]|nr:CoA-binding protein [Thermodesulfobacteriota bacterium]
MKHRLNDLEHLFHPRSIAIVGVSSNPETRRRDRFLRPLLDFRFKGPIYPINPKGGEILGLKILPSIKDVPGVLDFVIATTPARFGPQLIKECNDKGVKFVYLFTAGFGETGDNEGKTLEKEMVRIADGSGLRIVGPNCMGVYCPKARLSYRSDFPKEQGTVGSLCQSGGNSIMLVQLGASRGVRFSKVISYGNACDLNESDFLKYFIHDPDTEIIALYVEGVKDGQQFIDVLTHAAKIKPIVLLKGGVSEGGTRTVASHTGALAGSDTAWDALCKQLGVIRVYTLEELCDVLVTFQFMSLPKGSNVGIVGVGGGASVLAADECESNGLTVPSLPARSTKELMKFTPKAGNMLKNPIDSQVIFWDPGQFDNTVRILSDCKEINFILALLGPSDMFPFNSGQQSMYSLMAKTMLESLFSSSKPVAVVVQPGIYPERFEESFSAQQEFVSAGFPVYPTAERAANAIGKFIDYHNRNN